MINELLSRPNVQQFLNKYPSSRWKELITDLFEIGILNLRNSYYRDQFSHKELHAIIYDLEHPSAAPTPVPNTPYHQSSNNQYPSQKVNNQYQNTNFSYPRSHSINKKYIYDNNPNYNYDYERRKRRLSNLAFRATPSRMDAFYPDKDPIPKKYRRRTKREIQDKIYRSQQYREYQRYLIKDLKEQYMQDRKKELQRKRREKLMEKQAEEDIKEEEREKRRIKDEEDFQEGYKEDYQEEDEIEEDEQTDKYNDYNRGYDDDEEEEEEGEGEGEEYGGEEEKMDDGGEEYAGEEGMEEQQA